MLTLSDKSKAVHALEMERSGLLSEAAKISAEQMAVMRNAAIKMTSLSEDHAEILHKMAAIDDAIQSLLDANSNA